jgi:tetratricopeptide (TPR) repeat protein
VSQSIARARSLIELGRFQEALDALASADGAQLDTQGLCLGAQANLGLGRLDDARRLAEAAARSAPDEEWPVRLASVAALRQGHYPAARYLAQVALRLAPNQWRTLMQVAQTDASARAVTQDSWSAARRAVELAPNEPETHLTLGNVALADRDFRQARRCYLEALRLDPDNLSARNNLSVIDMRRQRFGRAAAGFRAAARVDPRAELPIRNFRAALAGALGRLCLLLMFTGLIGTSVHADNGRPHLDAALVGGACVLLAVGYLLALRARLRSGLFRLARRALAEHTLLKICLASTAAGYLFVAVGAGVGYPAASGWFAVGLVCALAGAVLLRVQIQRQKNQRQNQHR